MLNADPLPPSLLYPEHTGHPRIKVVVGVCLVLAVMVALAFAAYKFGAKTVRSTTSAPISKTTPSTNDILPITPSPEKAQEWSTQSVIKDEHGVKTYLGQLDQQQRIGLSIGDKRYAPGDYVAEKASVTGMRPIHQGRYFLNPRTSSIYKKAEDKIQEHLLLEKGLRTYASELGEIVVYQTDGVQGVMLSNAGEISKKWQLLLNSGVQIIDATVRNNTAYIAVGSPISPRMSCPLQLGAVEGARDKIALACGDIFLPSVGYAASQIVAIVKIDFAKGEVQRVVGAFSNNTHNRQIYFGQHSIYMFHEKHADGVEPMISFLKQPSSSILPQEYKSDIERILAYDISTQSKRNEIATLISSYKLTLAPSEAKNVQDSFQSMLDEHVLKSSIPFDGTLILSRNYDDMKPNWSALVHGVMASQNALLEMGDRIAVVTQVQRVALKTPHNTDAKGDVRIQVIDKEGKLGASRQVEVQKLSAISVRSRNSVVSVDDNELAKSYLFDFPADQRINATGPLTFGENVGKYIEFKPTSSYVGVLAAVMQKSKTTSIYFLQFPFQDRLVPKAEMQVDSSRYASGIEIYDQRIYGLGEGMLTVLQYESGTGGFREESSTKSKATELIQTQDGVYARISMNIYEKLK